MVNNDVSAFGYAKGVASFTSVAQATPNMTHNNVICRNTQLRIFQAYAVAGRGLTGNGEAVGSDSELRFELDRARDIKDDGAWALGRVDPVAKRSWARVVDVGDVINVSSATTLGESSVAFGAGECQNGPCGRGLLLHHGRVRQATDRGQNCHNDR
jgi:hypothetical protein